MNEEYRAALVMCPACSIEMERRTAGEAEVDVCTTCKGLWVDWFDGELGQVALQAAPLSLPPRPMPSLVAASCPHCKRAMESYGSIWRCGECGGTFVPRSSFEPLLDTAREPDPEPPPAARPGGLARLLQILAAFVKG